MASPRGRGPTVAKEMNRKLIYHHLKKCRSTTRAEMARELQLHKNTVNAIIDELAAAGYVRELGQQSTGAAGRKPVLIEFQARNKWAVGVQVTSTVIHWTVTDLYATPLESFSTPLTDRSPQYVASELARGFASLGGKYAEAMCIGIGLGIPGLIGIDETTIRSSHLGWNRVPLADLFAFAAEQEATHIDGVVKRPTERLHLTHSLPIPLHIDNSVKLAAFGEHWHGSGQEAGDFVYCYFGNGIGCSLFAGGGLVRGEANAAGELGHFVIEPDGPVCGCGNRGCLEALVSLPALARSASSALDWPQNREMGVEELMSALAGEDVQMSALLERTGLYIGRALSYVANLLNPSLVICDGPLMQVYDRLLPHIRRELHLRSVPSVGERIALTQSRLYPYASCIGAAAYVIERWESDEAT